jgi:hypothetical protein
MEQALFGGHQLPAEEARLGQRLSAAMIHCAGLLSAEILAIGNVWRIVEDGSQGRQGREGKQHQVLLTTIVSDYSSAFEVECLT